MKPAFRIEAADSVNAYDFSKTRVHFFWFTISNNTVRQKISIGVSSDIFSKLSLGLVSTLGRHNFGSFIGNNTIGWEIYKEVSNESSL